MWVLKYYFDIWNHLNGEIVNDLYDPLATLSDSEKTKVIQLFENTIDQVSFNTEDYRRIKNFLIDWYSSFRTLSTFESQISDPFSLPDSDLDELFRSFGYPYSNKLSLLNNKVNNNKVNFFLDLVNLYKIKGTPESILKVFTYYGISRAQIFEYALKRDPKDPDNHLIFEGIKAAFSGREIPLPTPVKNYELVTYDDPHWFYTEPQLLDAVNKTIINLPSRSPYFSLRVFYDMVGINATMAIINKILTDQFNSWMGTGNVPEQNAFITTFGKFVSFLELYLSMIYIYNSRNKPRNVIPTRYAHYFEDPTDNYDGIMTDYYQLHSFGYYKEFDPISGHEIKKQLDHKHREIELDKWYDNFSQPFDLSFIKTTADVKNILQTINPELLHQLDEIIDIYPFVDLLGPFLNDFQVWVNSYIGSSATNLAFLVLGEEEIVRQLYPVIDFFKPYHARLISLDMALSIEDRLNDSLLLDDPIVEKIVETTWDYASCDGEPCCDDDNECENCDNCGDYNDNVYVDAELRVKRHYSRARYDCGSCYDIGAACDCKPEAIKLTFTDTIKTKFTCRNTLFRDEPYEDISYVEVNGEWQVVRTPIVPPERLLAEEFIETIDYSTDLYYMTTSGGFTDFDCGSCFDSNYANDVCQILIIDH